MYLASDKQLLSKDLLFRTIKIAKIAEVFSAFLLS